MGVTEPEELWYFILPYRDSGYRSMLFCISGADHCNYPTEVGFSTSRRRLPATELAGLCAAVDPIASRHVPVHRAACARWTTVFTIAALRATAGYASRTAAARAGHRRRAPRLPPGRHQLHLSARATVRPLRGTVPAALSLSARHRSARAAGRRTGHPSSRRAAGKLPSCAVRAYRTWCAGPGRACSTRFTRPSYRRWRVVPEALLGRAVPRRQLDRQPASERDR